jgi:hypothetical protein
MYIWTIIFTSGFECVLSLICIFLCCHLTCRTSTMAGD